MVDLSFGSYDQRGAATVTRVEETTTTVNDHRIYRVHYTFRDAAGATHRARRTPPSPPEQPGAWDVEYQGDDPDTSRLVGMDRTRMPRFILFVLIFPLIGLVLALWQLRAGRASLRLLRHGAETSGKLIAQARDERGGQRRPRSWRSPSSTRWTAGATPRRSRR